MEPPAAEHRDVHMYDHEQQRHKTIMTYTVIEIQSND